MSGLFDQLPFPDTLRGHVVSPHGEPRIHGYAVQSDLAKHASFLDIGWLALTGNLPTERERGAVGCALAWLAPLHVGEGPVHALVLARVAGAPDSVLPGVAGVALGQHTAEELQQAEPLFRWLDGQGEPPPWAAAQNPDEATIALHDQLVGASAGWFDAPLPARPVLTRVAAAYALLYRLGIADSLRLQAFSAWARLPAMMAEAAYVRHGSVTTYPARLPDYEYVEEER